jgi:hypothetical protein
MNIVDGKSVPCEGRLFYRGIDINDIVNGFNIPIIYESEISDIEGGERVNLCRIKKSPSKGEAVL